MLKLQQMETSHLSDSEEEEEMEENHSMTPKSSSIEQEKDNVSIKSEDRDKRMELLGPQRPVELGLMSSRNGSSPRLARLLPESPSSVV